MIELILIPVCIVIIGIFLKLIIVQLNLTRKQLAYALTISIIITLILYLCFRDNIFPGLNGGDNPIKMVFVKSGKHSIPKEIWAYLGNYGHKISKPIVI